MNRSVDPIDVGVCPRTKAVHLNALLWSITLKVWLINAIFSRHTLISLTGTLLNKIVDACFHTFGVEVIRDSMVSTIDARMVEKSVISGDNYIDQGRW